MNPWVVLVLAIALFGGGFKLGVDHEYASQKREDAHVAEAVDAALDVTSKAIARIRVTNTTIQNEVQREIRTNTVYSNPDCSFTPDGLRIANEALAPRRPASASGVPRPHPTP